MSADTRLDQRLRDAFGADDDWIPDLSLADVRGEARRTTARRRTALAAAAVVLVGGVAVAANVDVGGRADSARPAPTSSPAPSPSSPTPEQSIEGAWLTPPLSARQVRSILEDSSLGAHADAVVDDLGLGTFNRFQLRIDDGYVDTWLQYSDQARDYRIDRQTYVVDGNRLVLSPRETDGTTVLTWSVDDDRVLRLQFVSTTEADYRGTPAEAFLRAIYTSLWFTG
jgi:hypothetical protein